MSTAISSPPSMRQQLDELDALLQRMLTLPINQLDDVATSESSSGPRSVVRTTPPPKQPYSPPRMRLLTDSSPVPPPEDTEPIGYERAFTLNLNPQNGSSVLAPRGPAVAPPRPSAPEPPMERVDAAAAAMPTSPPPTGGAIVSIEPLPAFTPTTVVAPDEPISAALRPAPPRKPPRRLTLNPLALLDALFVTTASTCGAPGEWLAGPVGKNLLGYTGLLMLGGCAAWGVLDWFGWTW